MFSDSLLFKGQKKKRKMFQNWVTFALMLPLTLINLAKLLKSHNFRYIKL